jgi:glutaredoxin 3
MGKQPKIEIYGTQQCGYCTAARLLLKKRGLHFEDIPVSTSAQAMAEMQERSGGTTVPQVFINGQAIGGFEELYELEQSGDLDKLLGTHVVVTDDQ